ncbi:MAG: hypothetical protein KatS3mg036_0495 [Ignavibacterium sp.]|uniref:hypothetical protein n=1 Tax=Ignavibacterium sp. TaxID=2651167 RepID=UPI0021DDBB8F|nr:hypothetical protein [Ignavibacterium sp.]BDQ01941.1 MAG: hypothetical protein KatS3mg037_0516 [Ignavibacterium sp.]GIV45677.1 MAG: hypothetical protein KatS3mg036_0495 [Ignavibacterium sp.]
MVDLKSGAKLLLQSQNIIVKSYDSTPNVLDDLEKLVFTDYAVALGNYTSERKLFAAGIDKIYHRLELIIILKSQTAKDTVIEIVNNIQKLLRLKSFTSPTLSISEVTTQSELIEYNARINYLLLELRATEFEQLQ